MRKAKQAMIAVIALVAAAPSLWAAPGTAGAAPSLGQSLGAPVSAQALAANRGGHIYQIGSAQLSAQLQDNQASNNVTGSNVVSQHAFSGSSGIPTLVQNSGNNVVIQNATVVNVQVQ